MKISIGDGSYTFIGIGPLVYCDTILRQDVVFDGYGHTHLFWRFWWRV